eukprot:762641-Pyramimonas_sp.AAC.1
MHMITSWERLPGPVVVACFEACLCHRLRPCHSRPPTIIGVLFGDVLPKHELGDVIFDLRELVQLVDRLADGLDLCVPSDLVVDPHDVNPSTPVREAPHICLDAVHSPGVVRDELEPDRNLIALWRDKDASHDDVKCGLGPT